VLHIGSSQRLFLPFLAPETTPQPQLWCVMLFASGRTKCINFPSLSLSKRRWKAPVPRCSSITDGDNFPLPYREVGIEMKVWFLRMSFVRT
jgi:hypothetical protein